MSPEQAARALHHSYALLSRLFQGGVNAALVPHIEAVPAMAAALPRPFDEDEAAAEHYRLFGYDLHPFASMFLDGSGLLGGPITEGVMRTYRQIGFVPGSESVAVDHLGEELALLAHLCAIEADAAATGRPAAQAQSRNNQRQFMDSHLLRWLPAFAIALSEHESPFYAAVGETAFSVVSHHFASLLAQTSADSATPFALPAAPDPLADQRTGLKEIAGFLVTPPFSGVYLGKARISRLARSLDLPRGFGSRQQMLRNLFESAAQFNQVTTLLNAVAALLADWQAAYNRISAEMPVVAGHIAPWQERVSGTTGLVARMHAEAGNTAL